MSEDGQKIDAPCKSWDCDHCGKVKKNRVLERARKGFIACEMGGKRIRFLTLTLGDNVDNRELMKFWERFRKHLYLKGYKFDYFWIKEFTKHSTS